jgi:hypothetical protein
VVANSTIGGCTAYYQRAETDARTATLLEQEWDYIVLQSYSILPTIKGSRETYLEPAVQSFVAKKKQAKIVMYLTWGYHDGSTSACPTGDGKCFPLGSNANHTAPPCDTSPVYHDKVDSFPCMGYAVARGYMDQLHSAGADVIAPCGLAWQVSRGSIPLDAGCKAAIDAEYTSASPFTAANNLSFPLTVSGLPPALKSFELYRKLGGASWDKHPNMAGQYVHYHTFCFGGSARKRVARGGSHRE